MSLLLTIITLAYIPLLDYLGLEPLLLHDVKVYTFIVSLSTIGVEINVALKEFLQSYEIVFFPNLVTITAVFLNLFLNFTFVFGMFGCPSFGVAGIAIATSIVRLVTALVMLGFCFYHFKFKNYVEKEYYKQLVKIGLPISTAIMIEFLSFNYIAIMLGKISGVYAAAHNIILVLINATFMIPFGISNALSVKVGYSNGSKNYDEMITYMKNGLGVTFLFTLTSSILFLIFPRELVSIFTSDSMLIDIIVPIMFIVALFQLSDGIQATLGGIYKGIKKTKFVMISNLIAYLFIGVSLGTFLGVYKKMYLYGCWIAICISSILLSTLLAVFLIRILKRLRA
jgi:MATE family multidrug resistance protein